MIWLFIICAAVVAALLQRHWADAALSSLHYDLRCRDVMVEVDEPATFVSTIENRGRLPILYVRLREFLPLDATVHGDEAWLSEHLEQRMAAWCVEDVFSLLPRRRRTTTLSVSFPRRGRYCPGSIEVTTGDFLGQHSATRIEFTFARTVVLPPRCEEPKLLHTLGGFMGDISVRRFILEDPVLTVGFREYTGREPMKAISWPQSARLGRLVAKEYDHTTDLSVTVLLNAEGANPEQLEKCLSITRTVCENLEKQGVPYDLRTNADLVGPMGLISHVSRGLGRRHLDTILYGLGSCGGRCTEGLEALVTRCRAAARSNHSYVVVTPPLSPLQKQTVDRLGGAAMTVLTGEEAQP